MLLVVTSIENASDEEESLVRLTKGWLKDGKVVSSSNMFGAFAFSTDGLLKTCDRICCASKVVPRCNKVPVNTFPSVA